MSSSNIDPPLNFIRHCFKENPHFPNTETYDNQIAWISEKWKRLSCQQKLRYEEEFQAMPVCCVHCLKSSDNDSGWYAMDQYYAEGFAEGFAGEGFLAGWNMSSDFPTTLEDGPKLISTLILKSRGEKLWICPSKECRRICFPFNFSI